MKNKSLRDSYKSMNCIACGARGCDPCHIRTYATSLEDDPNNIFPACRVHHIMQGQKGFVYMMERFPSFKNHLNAMGFYVQEVLGVRKLVKK